MTRNTLMDMHNILFEELERLNDDSLTGESLKNEVRRAKAIEGIAGQVTANTSNILAAMRLQAQPNAVRVPHALMGGE